MNLNIVANASGFRIYTFNALMNNSCKLSRTALQTLYLHTALDIIMHVYVHLISIYLCTITGFIVDAADHVHYLQSSILYDVDKI